MITNIQIYVIKLSLFVGYLRKTSNYLERKTLSDLTHMLSRVDFVAIGGETQRVDSICSLEKEHILYDLYESLHSIIHNCQSR